MCVCLYTDDSVWFVCQIRIISLNSFGKYILSSTCLPRLCGSVQQWPWLTLNVWSMAAPCIQGDHVTLVHECLYTKHSCDSVYTPLLWPMYVWTWIVRIYHVFALIRLLDIRTMRLKVQRTEFCFGFIFFFLVFVLFIFNKHSVQFLVCFSIHCTSSAIFVVFFSAINNMRWNRNCYAYFNQHQD